MQAQHLKKDLAVFSPQEIESICSSVGQLLSTTQELVAKDLPAGGQLLLQKMLGWHFFTTPPAGILSTELPIQGENLTATINKRQVNLRIISPAYKTAETTFVKDYSLGAAELAKVLETDTLLAPTYFRDLENNLSIPPKIKIFKTLQDFFGFPELFLFIDNAKQEVKPAQSETLLPVWCVDELEKRTDDWEPLERPWAIIPDTNSRLLHVQTLAHRSDSKENWQKITDYESNDPLPNRTPIQFVQRHVKDNNQNILKLELVKVNEKPVAFPTGSFKATILVMPTSIELEPYQSIKLRSGGKEEEGKFMVGLRHYDDWSVEFPWDWIHLLSTEVNQLLININHLKDTLHSFNRKDYLHHEIHQTVIDSFDTLKVNISREWIGHGQSRSLSMGKQVEFYLIQEDETNQAQSVFLVWVLFHIFKMATPLNSHICLTLYLNNKRISHWCSLNDCDDHGF